MAAHIFTLKFFGLHLYTRAKHMTRIEIATLMTILGCLNEAACLAKFTNCSVFLLFCIWSTYKKICKKLWQSPFHISLFVAPQLDWNIVWSSRACFSHVCHFLHYYIAAVRVAYMHSWHRSLQTKVMLFSMGGCIQMQLSAELWWLQAKALCGYMYSKLRFIVIS